MTQSKQNDSLPPNHVKQENSTLTLAALISKAIPLN